MRYSACVRTHLLRAILWSAVLLLLGCGGQPTAYHSVRIPSKPSSFIWQLRPPAVTANQRPTRPTRPDPNYEYQVGVDYHAYGDEFLHTTFITIYHQPVVRSTVLSQLQGMADRGATIIFTRIWFVTEPGTTDFGEQWRATFPMSLQEQANLRQYAQDVAAIRGTNGNRLRLNICLLWLGAADYNRGTPETGLGFTPLSAGVFTSRVFTTIDRVLAAITDITRPDGVHVADLVYFEGELMIGAKANQEWFMLSHYPTFVEKVKAAGLRPSVYFISNGYQWEMMQDGYFDAEYPILNNHRSMYWMYRSLKFMVDHNLYVPERIDFSWYITDPDGANFSSILKRTLNDADATLPSLGVPRKYFAAETHYFADPVARLSIGQAFANEAIDNPRLKGVCFWTTPFSGTYGVGYPFAIEDYLPQPH